MPRNSLTLCSLLHQHMHLRGAPQSANARAHQTHRIWTWASSGISPSRRFCSTLKGENNSACSSSHKEAYPVWVFVSCRRPLGHRPGEDGKAEVEVLLSPLSINSRSLYSKGTGKENTLSFNFVKPGVRWDKEKARSLPPHPHLHYLTVCRQSNQSIELSDGINRTMLIGSYVHILLTVFIKNKIL